MMTSKPISELGRDRLPRNAFTLIEMLVSTALVVLIMSLFAQIFALATSSVADQRTVARHDQKTRVLERAFRNDLDAMSFRQIRDAEGLGKGISPLHPAYPVDEERQRGYFEYSENDPASKTDDVLQFTVDLVNNRSRGKSRDEFAPIRFVGKTVAIGTSGATDQPVADDGNGAVPRTSSRAAEVSYFLRAGNLYRRVLILRDPPRSSIRRGQPSLGAASQNGPMLGSNKPIDENTHVPADGRAPGSYTATLDNSPVSFQQYPASTTIAASDYYNDSDIAATRYSFDPENDGVGDNDGDSVDADTSAIFIHTIDSLSNVTAERPLGLPWNRFGHFPLSPDDVVISPASTFVPAPGQPFEFLRNPTGSNEGGAAPIRGAPNTGEFIGRFTHGETSSSQFNWPGVSLGIGSPFNRIDLRVDSFTGVVEEFDSSGSVADQPLSGSRIAEDLMLGNVVAFDVKIWDDFSQQFVDLGGSGSLYGAGSLALSKNLTTGAFGHAYGPSYDGRTATRTSASANNVFDTWHPTVDGMVSRDINGNGSLEVGERNVIDGIYDIPPVWPRRSLFEATPDLLPNNAVAGDRITSFGPPVVYEEIASGDRNTASDFEGVWDTNNSYQVGDRVVPDFDSFRYLNKNIPLGSRLSSIVFECISATDVDGNGSVISLNRAAGGEQPNWLDAIKYGRLVDIGVGGDVMVWAPVYTDDRVGLKKLAITVTTRDPKTSTTRDLTVVHSFVE